VNIDFVTVDIDEAEEQFDDDFFTSNDRIFGISGS
jgi:hypothetical protein